MSKQDYYNPIWILCNPRTGSSHLCDLLNNTGHFPPCNHPGTVENIGPKQKGLAFNEWLRLYSNAQDFVQHPVPHMKAIHHQFVEVFGSANPETKWLVENSLPGIRYIQLVRTNLAEHAASLYFAKQTDTYHIYNKESLREYLDKPVPIKRNELMAAYQEVLGMQHNWDAYRPDIVVTYEDLMRQPVEVLRSIMDWLGLPDNNLSEVVNRTLDNRLFRMTRPNQKQAVAIIENRIAIL